MKGRLNFLFICSDQHRHDYLGLTGAVAVSTPNMDWLASSGTRYTHAFTPCPLCVPARASLTTGKHPERLGCRNNHYQLPVEEPTYYQLLRDRGYRVGGIGKFDLAKEDIRMSADGARPVAFGWGFTDPIEYEGKIDASGPESAYGYYTKLLEREGWYAEFRKDYRRRGASGWVADCRDSALPEDLYADTRIGEDSVRWLKGLGQDQPWHLFASFLGPHDPFDPPGRFAERYRSTPMPGPTPPGDTLPEHVHTAMEKYRPAMAVVEEARRQYCASIALIDHWIGEMVEVLRQRGELENTVIVYASDHGEMLGDRGLFLKQMPYEPSIRIPMIIRGPSLPQGATADTLVSFHDIYPTFCDLAGLDNLPDADGRSFAGSLQGSTNPHREHMEIFHENFSLIRTRQHKLVHNRCGQIELYDLEDDPLELENIADREPAMVRELESLFRR